MKKPLGEALVEAGFINEKQLAIAIEKRKRSGLKLSKQLLKLGFVGERELSEFMRDRTDMSTSLVDRKISPQAVKSVPQGIAFQYRVMPVAYGGNTIILATIDPSDKTRLNEISTQLGMKVHPIKALEWDIDNALLKYYLGFSDDELTQLVHQSDLTPGHEDPRPLSEDMPAPEPAASSVEADEPPVLWSTEPLPADEPPAPASDFTEYEKSVLQQALVELLVRKRFITEKELLEELIGLEGALSEE
jgi:type IV pilus assembly protein PilB